LQGASGTVVSNRPFAYSDANQLNGQAAMTLPAGDYTDFAWEPVGTMLYRRIRQGLLSRFEI